MNQKKAKLKIYPVKSNPYSTRIHPVKLFTMFNSSYLTWNSYFTGIIFLAIILFGFFGVTKNSFAAERIFYEDCENTNYNEHFLENHYGSQYESYWNELKAEVSQSNIAHSGSYSMMYNPWVTGNPHAVVGSGDVTYGNTSNFNLSSYAGRYWYFRWYERWESGATYSGLNKIIYINYGNGAGDFVLFLMKSGADTFLVTLKDQATYSLVVNDYETFSGGSLDDNEWHKMEIYIDTGTTGNGNGELQIKIDDIVLYSFTNLTYNSTISSNPIDYITGWPSNTSGETGSQQTWLDDLEIYILDGPNDIPDELTEEPDTTPPIHPIGLSVS